MKYKRIVNIQQLAQKKSCFLFGPRQTGKSTLLRTHFPQAKTYNLLHADQFFQLSQRPQLIRESLGTQQIPQDPIIIDEIQKLPILLDEVHACIEEFGARFILTGSSPRTLRRGGANLLGGRARTCHLFPLVSAEIGNMDLPRIWNFGALPSIYLSDQPQQDLRDYVGTYLQEEIHAEGLVRKIENFSRFLRTAALCNARLINFAEVANDAGIPPRTIIEYFRILQDTLVGYLIEPFARTTKRKAVSTAKFYFFDIGVCNLLAGITNVQPKTTLFGDVFEHFVLTELKAYQSYHNDVRPLTFWRSTRGIEVDFLLGADCAIEVKGTELATDRHLSGLHALAEEIPLRHRLVVSLDPHPRRIGTVDIVPIREFLHRLWNGDYQ